MYMYFLDLIGEGTFSKVYHGVCMGTEVAIKQLKIPLTTHDQNYFAAEVNFKNYSSTHLVRPLTSNLYNTVVLIL